MGCSEEHTNALYHVDFNPALDHFLISGCCSTNAYNNNIHYSRRGHPFFSCCIRAVYNWITTIANRKSRMKFARLTELWRLQ